MLKFLELYLTNILMHMYGIVELHTWITEPIQEQKYN